MFIRERACEINEQYYLFASISSHYFEENYRTNKVVVVIKQRFSNTFTNSLNSSEVYNSIKPAESHRNLSLKDSTNLRTRLCEHKI